MSNDKKFSDEFLNAFVDNQLTHEEKAGAYIHINEDAELSQRMCELRKVHDLVQLAYNNPPLPPRYGDDMAAGSRLQRGIAAGVVTAVALLLGTVLGWQLGKPVNGNTAHSATGADNPAAVATANPQQMKVLFHLNSGDDDSLKEALDEVEELLKYYKQSKQSGRIELVTNGEGINLLRIDTSPFPERIRRMQQEYDNLTFVACQNSLDILTDGHENIRAKLIPGTVVIDSGVAQIMRRQQQGWAYIRSG